MQSNIEYDHVITRVSSVCDEGLGETVSTAGLSISVAFGGGRGVGGQNIPSNCIE